MSETEQKPEVEQKTPEVQKPEPQVQKPVVQAAKPAVQAAKPTEAAVAKPAFNESIEIVGSAGTPYNINGSGFGAQRGRVFINDREVPVTRWRDDSIKGTLPGDLGPIKDAKILLSTMSGLQSNKK